MEWAYSEKKYELEVINKGKIAREKVSKLQEAKGNKC